MKRRLLHSSAKNQNLKTEIKLPSVVLCRNLFSVACAEIGQMGEDKDLSVMANVELKKVFPNRKIMTVTEMGLSANQEREEMLKKRLVWKVEVSPDVQTSVRGGPVDPSKLVVELGPMEIRTFVIVFDYIKMSVLP
ncbi:hypothetical protein ACLOJK_019365 [Asimina triloba]